MTEVTDIPTELRIRALEMALRQIIVLGTQPHRSSCCAAVVAQIALSAFHNNLASDVTPMRVCVHCEPAR